MDPSIYRDVRYVDERRDYLESLERPISIGSLLLYAARYQTNVAQSIPNNISTIINYGTITYDDGARVSNPTTAWTYTVGASGIYSVKASILFASTTTWAMAEAGSFNVWRNGANYSSLDRFGSIDSTTVSQFLRLRGTDDIFCAAGDTLNIRVIQNSGAALALHTDATFNYVAIAKIA